LRENFRPVIGGRNDKAKQDSGTCGGSGAGAGRDSCGAQGAPQTQAEQRAKAIEAAKKADSPAKRPLTDEDVQKYCAAQTEIVRAKRADEKSGKMINSADIKERTKKILEKNGLTMEEYTFISLRMNTARLYSGMNRCPETMKADCELYKKHKAQIVAAQTAQ